MRRLVSKRYPVNDKSEPYLAVSRSAGLRQDVLIKFGAVAWNLTMDFSLPRRRFNTKLKRR